MTHPSLEARARRIGAAARIGPEVTAAWLAAGVSTGPCYDVPAAIDSPRAFGTAFRQRVIARLTWMVLVSTALLPALVMLAFGPFGPVPRSAGIGLAAVLTTAAWLVLQAFATSHSMRSLRGKVEQGLASDPPAARVAPRHTGGSRHFVGLAPDAEPRLYEGFAEWDVGFLRIRDGSLDYEGEEVAFTIRASDVTDIRLDQGHPGWVRIHGVRMAASRGDGPPATLGFVPLDVDHAFQQRRRARQLEAEIGAWRAAGAATRAAGSAAGGPLGFGPPPALEVTSTSPRALQPLLVLVTLIVLGVLSLGATFLLGLPLTPFVRGGFDAVLATWSAYLIAVGPLLRSPRQALPSSAHVAARRAA